MDIAIDRMPFQTAKDLSFEGKHGAVVKLSNGSSEYLFDFLQ